MLCFLPRQSDRERAPFYASAMRQSDKDRVRPPLHMLASLGAHCLIMPAYAWCSVSFFSVHFATLTPLADSDIRGFFHIVTELDYPRRRLLLVHLLCSVPCVAPSAFFMTTFLDGLCSWCHGQFTTCVCCIFSRIFFCCSRIRARSLVHHGICWRLLALCANRCMLVVICLPFSPLVFCANRCMLVVVCLSFSLVSYLSALDYLFYLPLSCLLHRDWCLFCSSCSAVKGRAMSSFSFPPFLKDGG
jgi:hypothetical protein